MHATESVPRDASTSAVPTPKAATPEEAATEAVSAVQLGIWVSATRCVLTYVIAPAAGALGIFLGPLGLLLQVLGAITSTYGARALWRLGHRGRYVYALVATAVSAAALVALVQPVVGALR